MHYILKNWKKRRTRPGHELGKSGLMPSLIMQQLALGPTTLGPSGSFFFKFKLQILGKKMMYRLAQPRIQLLWCLLYIYIFGESARGWYHNLKCQSMLNFFWFLISIQVPLREKFNWTIHHYSWKRGIVVKLIWKGVTNGCWI